MRARAIIHRVMLVAASTAANMVATIARTPSLDIGRNAALGLVVAKANVPAVGGLWGAP